jgi:hypothetical protein
LAVIAVDPKGGCFKGGSVSSKDSYRVRDSERNIGDSEDRDSISEVKKKVIDSQLDFTLGRASYSSIQILLLGRASYSSIQILLPWQGLILLNTDFTTLAGPYRF